MNNKSRNWTFLVWCDSAPSNWIEIIQQTGVPFAVSPYHDKDNDPNGTQKKPHYHVVVCFDGPTTQKNINELFVEPLHTSKAQKVSSVRGIYRYFSHLDNPEKYQYDPNEIECFNGFHIDPTETEITLMKVKVINDINKYQIKDYNELVDYYNSTGEFDFFRVVSNNVYFFSKYIDTSLRNR